MSYPLTKPTKFRHVIPHLLSDTEVVFYANKARKECIEDMWHCKGLKRAIFIDTELAKSIQDRLGLIGIELPTGFIINDHFRLSKYKDGSFMNIHQDVPNKYHEFKSIYTINIFLNSDTGGTSFWSLESYGFKLELQIPAVAGTGVVFDMRYYHRGDKVTGEKLLLRTDVMVPFS